MRRRDFGLLGGGAAAGWPFAVQAQQRRMPMVGFLRSTSREDSTRLITAFQHGLKLGGYVEGENVTIEYRWADNQVTRQPEFVADLINRHVDVIVSNQGSSATVLTANKTIPVVFVIGGDPIKLGLVTNLNRPGGNVTGLTFLEEAVVSKHFQIIHELVPKAVVIAILNHSAHSGADLVLQDAQNAARALGLELEIVNVGDEDRVALGRKFGEPLRNYGDKRRLSRSLVRYRACFSHPRERWGGRVDRIADQHQWYCASKNTFVGRSVPLTCRVSVPAVCSRGWFNLVWI